MSSIDIQRAMNWVNNVVRPALRKEGSNTGTEQKAVTSDMSDDEIIAKAIQIAKKRVSLTR